MFQELQQTWPLADKSGTNTYLFEKFYFLCFIDFYVTTLQHGGSIVLFVNAISYDLSELS